MARGHIRQRGKGWVAVIPLPRDPVTQKRRQRWISAATKREAQQKLNRALAELDTGGYVDAGHLTVSQFIDRWLRDYAEVRLRPTSVDTYRTLLQTHVLPPLGALRLDALRPTHLQDLYRTIQAPAYRGGHPLSPASALLVHSILHRALFHAVRWQLLQRNPADHLEPPRKERTERPVLDLPQMAALLQEVAGTWLHLPILLAVAVGMSRGEILGLRWSDVRVQDGVLQVRQQIVEAGGEVQFGPLKRPSRKRNASIPDLLLAVFEQERAAQALLAHDLGPAYRDHGLVVCRADGVPYAPNSLTGGFRRLARRLGIPVSFHDLRHSHATLLLLLGVHPKIVSERMGHATTAMTLDVYSHVMPSMQSDTAALVDRALRGAIDLHGLHGEGTPPLKEPLPGTNQGQSP